MAKRSITALLVAAVLLLIPSCDAESFLRGFGANVLGGIDSEETVNQINDMVEQGITNYDELVTQVVKASRNPDTEKKLIDTLSQEASEQAVSTIENTVNDLSGQLDQIDTSSLPAEVQSVADEAISAVKKIAGTDADGGDYNPTKGDVAIIQAAKSLVEMFQDSGIGQNGSPSSAEIEQLISTANSALRMFNTIKSSTAFRNIDLNPVIDALIASANQSSGEEVQA